MRLYILYLKVQGCPLYSLDFTTRITRIVVHIFNVFYYLFTYLYSNKNKNRIFFLEKVYLEIGSVILIATVCCGLASLIEGYYSSF